MSEILLTIITIVVWTFLGGLVGWLYGYRAGLRKTARETIAEPIEYFCPECGAPLSNHCPGCPYDTEANKALL